MIDRRGVLRLAGAWSAAALCSGVLSAWPGAAARAGYWDEPQRKVAIHNLWTEEYLDIVYWAEGVYFDDALAEFSYIMRDRRNGQVADIFYGLIDQLFWLRKALGTEAPISLISGYRSPATNNWLSVHGEGVSRNSLHTIGMAADIRIEGQASDEVWRATTKLAMGGAGLYRDSDFVHIDVGPVRTWGS